MDIVGYQEDSHADYLPEHQVPKYSEGDIDRFKTVAQEAVSELKELADFDDEIELVLGVTDTDKLDDDAPTGYYFMGFSFDEDMRGYPRNAVFMRASDRPEEWEAAFKSMLVHELGHQVFYQAETDWEDDQYHSVMFEGHAENLARIIGDRNDRSFSPVWQKEDPIEVDKKQLYRDLEEPRGFEGKDHNMFLQGGERWSNAEGYTIAYQIVKHLIEEDEISIDSMLSTPSEKWKKLVDETIEEIY
jgi:hypothetical protein